MRLSAVSFIMHDPRGRVRTPFFDTERQQMTNNNFQKDQIYSYRSLYNNVQLDFGIIVTQLDKLKYVRYMTESCLIVPS